MEFEKGKYYRLKKEYRSTPNDSIPNECLRVMFETGSIYKKAIIGSREGIDTTKWEEVNWRVFASISKFEIGKFYVYLGVKVPEGSIGCRWCSEMAVVLDTCPRECTEVSNYISRDNKGASLKGLGMRNWVDGFENWVEVEYLEISKEMIEEEKRNLSICFSCEHSQSICGFTADKICGSYKKKISIAEKPCSECQTRADGDCMKAPCNNFSRWKPITKFEKAECPFSIGDKVVATQNDIITVLKRNNLYTIDSIGSIKGCVGIKETNKQYPFNYFKKLPFYLGDRVECVDDNFKFQGNIRKGEVYTIGGLDYSKFVDRGLLLVGLSEVKNGKPYYDSKRFRKVSTVNLRELGSFADKGKAMKEASKVPAGYYISIDYAKEEIESPIPLRKEVEDKIEMLNDDIIPLKY